MPISRVTAEWSGFVGAPGYSTFHFQSSTTTPEVADARGRVHSFFDEMSSFLAGAVRIRVSPTVEILDDQGVLVGYEEDETDLSTIFRIGGDTPYSAPSGAVVNWLTNTVRNGRRVRGRTFLVPLTSTAYQDDGTLTSAARSAIEDGAAFLSGGGFESGFGVMTGRTGAGPVGFAPVIGHRVPDMAAILRSRRD